MIDFKNTFKIEIDCKRFLQNSSKDQNNELNFENKFKKFVLFKISIFSRLLFCFLEMNILRLFWNIINNFLESRISTVETSNLGKNIFAIVIWHLHSLVVISKSWVWHFQSFHRNSTDSSQICLITLAL